MKLRSIALLGVAFFATGAAQRVGFEKRAISYAKQIPTSKLEAGLPDQQFADWFGQTVGRGVRITWEVNDCGEQSGGAADIGRDFPSCVDAIAELSDSKRVVVRIAVGTFHTGVTATPTLADVFLEDKNNTANVKKLSELSKVLATHNR